MIRTMEIADGALAAFERLAPPELNKNCYLEPYQNGRERGWAIQGFMLNRRKVAFSEYRNTDQIVVYAGGFADFANAGNVPAGKVYEGKTFFSYNDFDGAAQYIIRYLMESET